MTHRTSQHDKSKVKQSGHLKEETIGNSSGEEHRIHGRISRTQREQSAAIDKLESKVDRLSDSLNFVHGVVSSIPAKLDSIQSEIEKKQR